MFFILFEALGFILLLWGALSPSYFISIAGASLVLTGGLIYVADAISLPTRLAIEAGKIMRSLDEVEDKSDRDPPGPMAD